MNRANLAGPEACPGISMHMMKYECGMPGDVENQFMTPKKKLGLAICSFVQRRTTHFAAMQKTVRYPG